MRMSTFNDRGRPATDGTPSKMSIATDSTQNSTPNAGAIRCRCCRRVLTADVSVRLELGPVCRRLFGDLGEVAA